MKHKVIAFIHAKGSSTRVPGKNMRVLGGKPLFCHAIENALNAEMVDLVVVDSDSDDILEIGEKYGAVRLKRPESLATNDATGDDLAYWQASNYKSSEIVLQVIPTSPFIKSSSIDKAVNLLQESQADSVVGVHSEVFYEWRDGRPVYFLDDGRIPNSFEKEAIVYETTGLYVNKTEYVVNNKRRLNKDNCFPYFLSKLESIDINTEEDFQFAKIILKGLYEE